VKLFFHDLRSLINFIVSARSSSSLLSQLSHHFCISDFSHRRKTNEIKSTVTPAP